MRPGGRRRCRRRSDPAAQHDVHPGRSRLQPRGRSRSRLRDGPVGRCNVELPSALAGRPDRGRNRARRRRRRASGGQGDGQHARRGLRRGGGRVLCPRACRLRRAHRRLGRGSGRRLRAEPRQHRRGGLRGARPARNRPARPRAGRGERRRGRSARRPARDGAGPSRRHPLRDPCLRQSCAQGAGKALCGDLRQGRSQRRACAAHARAHLHADRRLGRFDRPQPSFRGRRNAGAGRHPAESTTPTPSTTWSTAIFSWVSPTRRPAWSGRCWRIDNHQADFAAAYALSASPVRLLLEQDDWAEAAALSPDMPAGIPWEKFPQTVAMRWFAKGLGAARLGEVGYSACGRRGTEGSARNHAGERRGLLGDADRRPDPQRRGVDRTGGGERRPRRLASRRRRRTSRTGSGKAR